MTDKRNPDLFDSDGHEYWTDITLRDVFAAFSAAGMVAKVGPERGFEREIAEAAYACADAMLDQRRQSKGEEA